MPININCKQYDKWGNCNDKSHNWFFGKLRSQCLLLHNATGYCKEQIKHPRPERVSPPPPPKKYYCGCCKETK